MFAVTFFRAMAIGIRAIIWKYQMDCRLDIFSLRVISKIVEKTTLGNLLEKSHTKCGRKTIPRPSSKNKKRISLDQ